VAPCTRDRLWALAAACTPHDRVAEYTQAIMDLGSAVCTRSRPACDVCPLRGGCYARLATRQHDVPSSRTRRQRPAREAWALAVFDSSGALLLERRPSSGLWGGLWSLPMFETEADAWGWCHRNISQKAGASSRAVQRHVFTHFEMRLHVLTVQAPSRVLPALQRYRWYDPANRPRIGVTRAVTRLLAQLAVT
jgi:A/G-specific adenine glycosylase